MPNQQYGNVGGAKPNGWNGDVGNGGNPGQAPWAIYQNAGKVPANAMNTAQQPQVAAQARKVSQMNAFNALLCSSSLLNK